MESALVNDPSTVWSYGTIGVAGTLENSQCKVNTGGGDRHRGGQLGDTLRSITFMPAFQGTWQIREYVFATSASGWQNMGTWTVPEAVGAPTATAVSVTPNSGSGSSQTFQVVAASSLGSSDIRSVWLWFNSSMSSSANNCLISYSPANRGIGLVNDASTVWSDGIAGVAGTLENSQCAVNLGAATGVTAGNNLTFSIPITFKAAFQGDWQIREYVFATANSEWQNMGTWTVPQPGGAPTVTAVSVAPNSGARSSQTFQVVASSSLGSSDVRAVWLWFNSNMSSSANNCLIAFSPSNNAISLVNDASTVWSYGNVGVAGVLENSQCSINPAAATSSIAGNNVTFSIPITFKAAFRGTWQVREYVFATAASGWQNMGAWTVP